MTTVDKQPTDEQLRQAAKVRYESEGAVEIEADAPVSCGDDGAYVQAWVFVRYSEVSR